MAEEVTTSEEAEEEKDEDVSLVLSFGVLLSVWSQRKVLVAMMV